MPALTADQVWDRHEQFQAIANQSVDVLVVGAGASGAGVFLDALSRGLSAVLIDRQDFMAGTSSRSTKLVHGGVRYLEQAVKELNIGKYQLVKEALAERRRMLEMAPHLAWKLNLITPVKGVIGLPYFRIGLGVYDFLSGSQKIGGSKIEGKKSLAKICPELDLKPLTGGVSYYDGQFDDARFGVAMVRTGLEMGGHALNYATVESLLHEGGNIAGVKAYDQIGEQSFEIKAKVVINCTGPWTDHLREMADPDCKKLMTVSSGIHILIERDLLPEGRGILIPETEDGRVLFMLPWLGKTLVGTTDDPAELSDEPNVSEDEIQYVLRTANSWLKSDIKREEVTASWSGLRPLVSDPDAESTSKLSRDHVVLNDNGLISLTGGKWTTWRKMAEDCVDEALKTHNIQAKKCDTHDLRLAGARGDTQGAKHALAHLPDFQADYLWRTYGDRAPAVLTYGDEKPLIEGEPYTDAELRWVICFEGACTVDDVLRRRLRVGMLDEKVADQLKPYVGAIFEERKNSRCIA